MKRRGVYKVDVAKNVEGPSEQEKSEEPPVGIIGEEGEVRIETNCPDLTVKMERKREKEESKQEEKGGHLGEEIASAFEKMRDDPDGLVKFTDPKKMKEMSKKMEEMGAMDERTLRILNDVKSNPEAISEIQKMAREMGIQDRVNSSVGEQRRMLKMQKQMKKNMNMGTTRKLFKCLRVNQLKKVKVITVEMTGSQSQEEAMCERLIGDSTHTQTREIGKYVVAYMGTGKDKLIEKHFGNTFGPEVSDLIIAMKDFSVLTEKDFTRVAKEIRGC